MRRKDILNMEQCIMISRAINTSFTRQSSTLVHNVDMSKLLRNLDASMEKVIINLVSLSTEHLFSVPLNSSPGPPRISVHEITLITTSCRSANSSPRAIITWKAFCAAPRKEHENRFHWIKKTYGCRHETKYYYWTAF